ncbi:hypothetical protein CXU21_06415 [Akkermansia muciniphila]|nr:hypothetical protein CXU21_06415 [Akkermansia muciniphila]
MGFSISDFPSFFHGKKDGGTKRNSHFFLVSGKCPAIITQRLFPENRGVLPANPSATFLNLMMIP